MVVQEKTVAKKRQKRVGIAEILKKDWQRNKLKYLLVLPVVIWYILFCYKPLYGILVAFKDYSPVKGIMGSNWVGVKYFAEFFRDPNFIRTLRNTLLLSFYSIIFSFPMPIIYAILVNEIRNKYFKTIAQSISFFPHFISLVVICGMITQFCSNSGIISQLMQMVTGEKQVLLQQPGFFRPMYILSDIWQETGFSSIIYFAALCGISHEVYEAAELDGAGRVGKIIHVSIPGIMPTIIIMLILRVGQVMSLGADKVILLYNPLTYETADIISSYVYRKGLQDFNWGLSTAVGLFNNIVNVVCLITVNKIAAKVGETSLW